MTQTALTTDELSGRIPAATPQGRVLADVLFDQLEYLIQFADQEHDRLERVRAVLMEPFN